MFLAPVYIHGYILFNIIVISKIGTSNSHLWSCVCYYKFLAVYDKRSIQSNHICKFGKFHCVCVICCNLDSQITHTTEDLQAPTHFGPVHMNPGQCTTPGQALPRVYMMICCPGATLPLVNVIAPGQVHRHLITTNLSEFL